jgi:alpha-ketoglutaric semialdehyde dehydrogenase
MKLTGNLLTGAQEVSATTGTFKALNPATNVEIEPSFALGGVAEVDRAAQLADEAFDSYNNTSLAERAAFLDAVTVALEPFLRPVCYQGFPDDLLPEALQRDNPRGIWRLTDGELSKA